MVKVFGKEFGKGRDPKREAKTGEGGKLPDDKVVPEAKAAEAPATPPKPSKPELPDGLFTNARALIAQGKHKDALETLVPHQAIGKNNPTFIFLAASAIYGTGNKKRAFKYFTAFVEKSPRIEAQSLKDIGAACIAIYDTLKAEDQQEKGLRLLINQSKKANRDEDYALEVTLLEKLQEEYPKDKKVQRALTAARDQVEFFASLADDPSDESGEFEPPKLSDEDMAELGGSDEDDPEGSKAGTAFNEAAPNEELGNGEGPATDDNLIPLEQEPEEERPDPTDGIS